MLGRTTYFAVSIAIMIVHVVPRTSAQAAQSICSKADECYVNGSLSKVCKRTEKTCNRCITEIASDSIWSTVGGYTEYACYASIDGECPTGTTLCAAKLEPLETRDTNASSTLKSDTEPRAQSNVTNTLRTRTNATSVSRAVDESTARSVAQTTDVQTDVATLEDTSDRPTPAKRLEASTTLVPETVLDTDEPIGYSTSDSTSASLESDSTSTATTFDNGYAAVQSEYESRKPFPVPIQVSATVAPGIAEELTAVADPTVVERKADQSNTASGNHRAGSNQMGLILGLVAGAVALVAVAGFVAWKKRENDDDDDDDASDDDAAFSPIKPAAHQHVAAPPSASSATTAYTAQPIQEYGNQYNNNPYTHTYDAGGYHPGTSSTSPVSMGFDDETLRRTDSILGGTGYMLSTKTGGAPFELSGGPSPSFSDSSHDAYGHETLDTRPKRTLSSASVEF